MEGTNLSINSATHLLAENGEEGAPFSREVVQLTKQQIIQLKWEAGYWKTQHDRLLVRSAEREQALKAQHDRLLARYAELEQKLEHALAKNRDLRQRLYGKRSEQGASKSEAQSSQDKPSRPRGQTPGTPGHGRTLRPSVSVGVAPRRRLGDELRTLQPEKLICAHCNKAYSPCGTENSDLLEIWVKGYVRKVKRQRYQKPCDCPGIPEMITAPPAPRLIPKSTLGISVWVEVFRPSICTRFPRTDYARI